MSFRKRTVRAAALAVVLTAPALVAQHSGGGSGEGGGNCAGQGGGGGGCGDLYGDLYVIARDDNGVPLAVLWPIEGVPTPVHQPLDIDGNPIPLGPEGDALFEEDLVEVEFGRCNSMRAPAKVSKMRFDSVISAIRAADTVRRGVDGRLVLEFDGVRATLDSPVENLALYKHLMKRGHFQSDPMAIDDSHGTHGETVYRPALREEDYAKFLGIVRCLLPNDGNITWDANGHPDPVWLQPEPLDNRDLRTAACLLAAGADKTAWITVDTVEYLHGIMGIKGPAELFDPVDPSKTFFDFRGYSYLRTEEFDEAVEVLVADGIGGWQTREVDVSYWLHHVAPLPNYQIELTNVAAFVQTANDALRIIEFVHNYAPPEPMWTKTVFDGPFVFQ